MQWIRKRMEYVREYDSVVARSKKNGTIQVQAETVSGLRVRVVRSRKIILGGAVVNENNITKVKVVLNTRQRRNDAVKKNV